MGLVSMSKVKSLKECVEQIHRLNAHINAFTHIAPPLDSEQRLPDSKFFAVKDNIAVRGMPLSCGSAMLGKHRPLMAPEDATAVRLLREFGGMVVVGKTNLDEFGMGSHTSRSFWGPTINPHSKGAMGCTLWFFFEARFSICL